MKTFHVSASYQTRTGGMSWRHFDIEATDLENAIRKAEKRIGKTAVRALDMRLVEIPVVESRP